MLDLLFSLVAFFLVAYGVGHYAHDPLLGAAALAALLVITRAMGRCAQYVGKCALLGAGKERS